MSYETRKRALTRTSQAGAFIFNVVQTCDKSISIVYNLPSLWYFVRAALRYKDRNEHDINKRHVFKRNVCASTIHRSFQSKNLSALGFHFPSAEPLLSGLMGPEAPRSSQNWELLPAHLCNPSPGSDGQRPSIPLSLFYTEITMFYADVSGTEVVQFMMFFND